MSILPCCRDVTALLTEDAEGSVAGFAKLKLTMHLSICTPCQRMRSQLRTTTEVLRGLARETPEPPSSTAVDAIMSRLAAATDEDD